MTKSRWIWFFSKNIEGTMLMKELIMKEFSKQIFSASNVLWIVL